MNQKTLIVLIVVILAAYFLYEPVMDRYFTDHSLKVSESSLSLPDTLEEIPLISDRLELTFSPHGGRIVSARLKDYFNEDQETVELVSNLLKTRSGMRIEVPGTGENLDDATYSYTKEENQIRFIQRTSEGMEISKSYELLSHYGIRIRVEMTNVGDQLIDLPHGYRLIPFYGMHIDKENKPKSLKAVWLEVSEGNLLREKAKKVKEPIHAEESVDWVGIHNRYFTQIIASRKGNSNISFHPLGERQVYASLTTEPFALEPGDKREDTYLLYLGPLSKDALSYHKASLEKIIDYGTFDFLGKGVLYLLRWLNGYASNYGLCLVLLAILIRIILFPVTQYNLKSLRDMPRILDQIYTIEEDEKDNPEQAEERIRPLRKKQINSMIGSFLPLAIQIPIFLALYEVLNNSLDLRGAGFLLWVKDLSVRDPLFLLPLFMGLAMILQQRLTSANPESDKTWIWMPLGFALLFSFFPAGLVLFWLTDSILSVAQLSWIAKKT